MRAEEKARIAAEEARDAEETKRREEEKARKKQKEKERIEQLKREGKYMTKAQKEEKARNERKLQQMIDAGIKIGGLEEGETEKEKEKEKKKADARKRGGRTKVRTLRSRTPLESVDADLLQIDEDKALAEAAERARLGPRLLPRKPRRRLVSSGRRLRLRLLRRPRPPPRRASTRIGRRLPSRRRRT